MDSYTQVFFNFSTTLRTLLRSSPSINFTEELSTLPANILNDASKLSKCSVKSGLLNDVSPATKLSEVLAMLDMTSSSSLWGSSRRIR